LDIQGRVGESEIQLEWTFSYQTSLYLDFTD